MTENPSQDRTPRYGEQDPPQNTNGQGPGPYGYGQYDQGQPQPGQYGQNPYGAPQYQGGSPAYPQGGAPMPSYQGQTPAQAAGPAPQSVRRGALLVYIACGIGVVGAVLLALPAFQEDPVSAVGSILGNLVVFALGIAGAILTVKGHNWARITSLVFACLSVVRLLVGLFGLFMLFTAPVLGIGSLLQTVSTALYITGVIFFWVTPSSLWFRSRGTVMY